MSRGTGDWGLETGGTTPSASVGPWGYRGGRSHALWRGLACLLLLLGASAATAQEVRLYVLADTVALGEPFDVAVAADHAPGVQAVFPEVPRDRTPETGPLLSFGDIEATDLQRFAPVLRGDVRTDSVVYRALAFAADTARVGPVEVAFATGPDTVRVASGVGLIRVRQLVPGPEAEPEPPAEPFPFPSPVPVWIAFGVLALLAIGLGVWAARRYLKRPRPTPRLQRPPPYSEVVARLDALAADVPTPATAQAWLFSLADALRTYVERRLRIPAHERTTRELDAALASRLPDAPRITLRGVLRVCDRGKFADLRPGAEAAREVLDHAREATDAIEALVKAREEAARQEAATT